MSSKLQHVINHMDMYHILTETFLAWKGVGALKKLVILILKSKEYQSVILIVLDDCHITRR